MATKQVIQHFESSGAYVEHVKTCQAKNDWRSLHSSSDSWAGGSLSQALDLASNGWSDGLKRMQKDMDVLKIEGKWKSRVNDVAGDFPIVPRAIAGLPDAMSRRTVSTASRKPIIDIYLSPVMTSQGKADKFITLGAAIVDFIDSCESVGYSVTLTTSMIATGYSGDICGSVFPLKKAGESLDLEKIVYFIAHPTFLRRLGFQDFASKLFCSELGQGMGRPVASDIHISKAESGALMFVTTAESVNRISCPADAKKWVLDCVKTQRPELLESLSANAA